MGVLNILAKAAKTLILISLLLLISCGTDRIGPVVEVEKQVPVEIEVDSSSLNFGNNDSSGKIQITITAAPGLGVDADTLTENGDNNSQQNAQPIASDSAIAGFADRETDAIDWYSVSGVSGKSIRLDIDTESVENDLDLYLYQDFGDGTAELVDASLSVTAVESLMFPEDGNFLIEVSVFSGKAAYFLSIADSDGGAETRNGSRLSSLARSCDGTNNCSKARAGQWIMTTSSTFSEEMATASKAQISSAQETMINAMGMTLDGGAGTGLLKTGMQDYSAQGWVELAKSVGQTPVPWSEEDADVFRFNSEDLNQDTIPDQQELLLTILIGKRIDSDPSITSLKSVGINFTRRLKALPNDNASLVSEQFASHYSLIRLEEAWDSNINNAQGLQDVLVAVLDTGIVPLTGPEAHPDWADVDTDASDSTGKLKYGFDFVSEADIDGDATPGIDSDATDIGPADSTSFHGTHVAGTVAAPTDNGIGVAGVGRSVSIMPIRVLGSCGCGSTFDILQGNLYAAQLPNDSGTIPNERADIINMSLGGGGFSRVAQDVYADVRAQGVIIIAAAGNESTSEPSYPASYDGVVSVSAASHGSGGSPSDVVLAQYSNFGSSVDVSAPGGQSFADANGDGIGDGVLSTVGLSLNASGYEQFNGTSMAAPHVAGVAALMESVHPNLTPDEFDEALNNRTIVLDVGQTGRDDSFGTGLIDAFNAVRIAEQLAGISPTPQPNEPLPQPAEPTANAVVSPTSLNFGSGLLSLNFEVRNSGDTNSQITQVNVSSSSDALVVRAADIEPSGLGTYAATIERSLLSDGSNELEITVTTDANNVSVPVSAFMPTGDGRGSVGKLHVVLLDASSLRQENCSLINSQGGVYSTEFENVETGDYFVIAGTDADEDGLICGPFEACGAYESLSNISQITDSIVDLNVTYSLFDLFPSGQFRGCD